MTDKASVLKASQKFLAKGQIDKAIQLWENYVSGNPDGNTFNTIGDLYLKSNDRKRAALWFHKAAKFLRDDGFYPKAIAIYKKVLNIDSSDPGALRSLGELNEEKGLVPDAIKFYLATIDALHKKKNLSSVIDIYNKILNIAPSNIPLRIKIAENLIREGFREDASREFAYLARLSEEKGDSNAASEHFERALQLQPKNKSAYLSMCKLYETVGKKKESNTVLERALKVFPDDSDIQLQLADLMISDQNFDKARDILGRIGEKEPENIKVREKIAHIHLKKGQKEKAWQIYNTIFDDMLLSSSLESLIKLLKEFKEIDPVDVGKRLASLYKQTGKNDDALQELVSVGSFLKSSGLTEEALEVLNEARQLDSEHHEVVSLINSITGSTVSDAPGTAESGIDVPKEEPFIERTAHESFDEPSLDTISDGFDEPIIESTAHEEIEETAFESPPIEDEEPISFEAKTDTEPLQEKDKSTDELLTEVEVLLRYGQNVPALEILEQLKSKEPANIDVHKKLKNLYMETGEKELAITECLVLANLYEKNGDSEKKEILLHEAFDIDPNDPRLADRLKTVSPETATKSGKKQFSPADFTEEISEADFYFRQGLIDEALKIYRKYSELMPDNAELQDKIRTAQEELETSDKPSPETQMDEVFTSMSGKTEPHEFSLDLAGEDQLTTSFPEEVSADDIPGDIQLDDYSLNSVEEVSSFSDSLEESSEDDLTAELGSDFTSFELPPSESSAFEAEVDDTKAEELVEAVPDNGFEALSVEDMEADTAEEIIEPTLESDVLEIFEEFKKGIETELEEEDSDTHYNLGIAYKEMGLIDDAIKEFQTANKDPNKRIQASSMLGVCYKEKGLYSLAVDSLKHALAAIPEHDDAYWGTKYDLAEAYQQNGNIKESFEIYTEIYSYDSKFRNVHEKMNALKGVKVKEAIQEDKQPPPVKKKKDRISYI